MKKIIWIGACVAMFGVAGLVLAVPSDPPETKAAAGTSSKVFMPLSGLSLALDGFHFRDGQPDQQMEAMHYCSEAKPGLIQCALFDGTGNDARLIGVEYVISEERARALPDGERALWHSHSYEVTSGMLLQPGASAEEQKDLMKSLVGTYGKTWHTWQTDLGQDLPTGRPYLMMAFTKPGDAKPTLTDRRDKEFAVSTEKLRRARADLKPPALVDGVDRGEKGQSCMGGEMVHPVRGTEDEMMHPAEKKHPNAPTPSGPPH